MYRKRLLKTIDEMEKSVIHWVSAAWRKSPPKLAEDELASTALRDAIQKLIRRWYGNFDKMAEELAKYFAQKIGQRSDAALRRILKEGGFSVEFKLTAAMREIIGAAVHENVSLIKSIPQQCLTQVEGFVMRSVETGRDLGSLTKALRQQFGVTRKRAAFIARDQNNKVTASLTRARQLEMGITQAIWVHSSAGAEPRPSHVKAGRERTQFDLRMGWYDPDVKRHILPGELPNCRCFWKPVIKGFS